MSDTQKSASAYYVTTPDGAAGWPLPTPQAEPEPKDDPKPRFINMLTPGDIQLIREALANYSLSMRLIRFEHSSAEQLEQLLEQFRAYMKEERLTGVALTRLFR